MLYETKQHACPICRGNLDKALMLWDKTHRVRDKDVKYIIDQNGEIVNSKTVLCPCGLAQALRPMTIRSLNEFYKEIDGVSEYRKIYPIPGGHIENHMNNALRFLFEGQKRVFLSTVPRVQVLLVGSGDGISADFLRESWKDSADIYTYEPGMPESESNFRTKPNQTFNLIMCQNTLEHVYDPISFMEDLATMCDPDTLLLITVPDLLTRLVTMGKDQWFSCAHNYHFSRKSLTYVILLSGFKIIDGASVTEEMGDKHYVLLQINPEAMPHGLRHIAKVPLLGNEYLSKIVRYTQLQDDVYRQWKELSEDDRSTQSRTEDRGRKD